MNQKNLMAVLLSLSMTAGITLPLSAAEQGDVPEQIVTDGGVEVVEEVQKMPSIPVKKTAKNARQALINAVKARKWKNGWDNKKKRFIVIEAAEVDTPDPPAIRISFFFVMQRLNELFFRQKRKSLSSVIPKWMRWTWFILPELILTKN